MPNKASAGGARLQHQTQAAVALLGLLDGITRMAGSQLSRIEQRIAGSSGPDLILLRVVLNGFQKALVRILVHPGPLFQPDLQTRWGKNGRSTSTLKGVVEVTDSDHRSLTLFTVLAKTIGDADGLKFGNVSDEAQCRCANCMKPTGERRHDPTP